MLFSMGVKRELERETTTIPPRIGNYAPKTTAKYDHRTETSSILSS
jgi:hypothetical protein